MVEKTSKITHILKKYILSRYKRNLKNIFSSVPKILEERIHKVVLNEGFS